MMLMWRALNHARPLARRPTSLLTASRCFSDSSHKAKRQSRLLRNKPVYALLLTGVALYAYYGYIAAEKKQDGSFQRYSIVEKSFCTSTSSIFKLRPQEKLVNNSEKLGLWSIEIKQPQLQIAREYTPIPDELVEQPDGKLDLSYSQQNQETLEFWIRREPHGEVSNYLHNLKLNDMVELRGPISETPIPDAQEIVFVAGGTGITPAIQLAHILLARCGETDRLPHLSILWANRKREDCLGGVSDNKSNGLFASFRRLFSTANASQIGLEKAYIVQRLDSLKRAFKGSMQVEYYVDEEKTRISKRDVLSYIEARKKDHIPNAKRVIMVCGPDGFVAHFAGPKEWSNGKQIQGKVTGVLQDARQLGWDVVKL